MDKPEATDQKATLPSSQDGQAKRSPDQNVTVIKKVNLKNTRILKVILPVIIIFSVFTLLIFSVIYYKRDFTPSAILTRSIGNLVKNKNMG